MLAQQQQNNNNKTLSLHKQDKSFPYNSHFSAIVVSACAQPETCPRTESCCCCVRARLGLHRHAHLMMIIVLQVSTQAT